MSLSKITNSYCFSISSKLISSFKQHSFLVRNSFCKTLKKPEAKILRATKLAGLGLSLAGVPLLRFAECRPIPTLSKRVDHLKCETVQAEPTLSLWDIWSLIKPYIGWFFAAVVCAVLTAIVNIQLPLYLGELIDVMVELIKGHATGVEKDVSSIKPQAFKLVTCYLAQAVLTFMYITFISILGERICYDVKLRLFEKLLIMDMSFYDTQKSGELSSRLNVDIQEFKSCFKLTVAQGLKTLAQTLGCVVTLFYISPSMTVVTVAALPAIILVGTLCGAILRSLSRKAQAQSAIAASVSDEALSNISTVRSFAMEVQETNLYKREVNRARFMNELLAIGIGAFQGTTNFFLNGIVLTVLYSGSSLINSGLMTPGDLMSFLVTAQTIQKSLSQLSVVFGHALRGWTAGARVFEFIKLQPTTRMDDGVCIPYHTLWGELEFENVSFHYPTRPGHVVFDDLNLTIPAGQIVALCGPSGQGKSTITSLLERFYDPTSGIITLDGKDLRSLNLEWLRGQVIGLISQEPVLFATTIEENIRYGRPDAADYEVYEAARLANAHSFINEFPEGYKTVVGERGTQLSGGQKQRIAIARALLKNPPILILDEATSALDTDSERLVREALERAMKGRTVLIIAHRLSTIQSANLICVVKDKKITEKGTHEELMKKKGQYYNLVQSQYSQL
ncbi:unnamed protein product [Auanema sp. JU1783]|nr:unnamed protein product [Auanema sp. JU1783]